jgi:hypothetical protein
MIDFEPTHAQLPESSVCGRAVRDLAPPIRDLDRARCQRRADREGDTSTCSQSKNPGRVEESRTGRAFDFFMGFHTSKD